MELLGTLANVILMVVGFGLLIFIHELGHFIAAKWAGIRTEGFAIGMGHVVVSWRKGLGMALGSSDRAVVKLTGQHAAELSDAELTKHGLGETEYSLRWLPFGGFVKMLGQEDANPKAVSDDPRSYNMCGIGKRMIVVSAGVIMNVLLAIVLFIIAFLAGVKFEAPVVGSVQAGSPAATTMATNAELLGVSAPGLIPGDRVLTVNGKEATTFADLQIASAMAKPDVLITMTVERVGLTEPLVFELLPREDPQSGLLSIGIAPGVSTTLVDGSGAAVYRELFAASPLPGHGVELGMRLLSVQGDATENFGDVSEYVQASTDGSIVTTWSALDEAENPQGDVIHVDLALQPQFDVYQFRDADYDQGILGFSPLQRIKHVDPDSPNIDVLMVGDVLVRAGDLHYPRGSQLRKLVNDNAREKLELVVLRDGAEKTLECEVSRKGRLGIVLERADDVTTIAQPVETFSRHKPDEPAEIEDVHTPLYGIAPLAGARFASVNDTPVDSWRMFRDVLIDQTRDAAANETEATVYVTLVNPLPGNPQETLAIALAADQVAALHELSWVLPIDPQLFEPVYVTLDADNSPLRALVMGYEHTSEFIVLTYLTIDRLIRGSVGVEQLRGPVGIVHIGTQVAHRGLMYLVFLLAVISVNLAVLNFLPLPIVDGGLFLFLVYEKLKGRPPSIAFQNAATLVGLALIGTLFVVVTWNDLMRLLS